MAGEKLELPIGIPVETNADEAASSVESLRASIEGSTAEIKAMAGTLRQLRGASDDVKAAKAQLTAKMESLKGSVSAASLALVKQGTSYDAAAQRAKKYATEQKSATDKQKAMADALKKDELAKSKGRTDAMSAAISKAGGPVAALKGKLDSLKSVLGETGGSSAMGLVTLATGAAVAAVAALAIGLVAGGAALAGFILKSANAARSAGLMREAWSGTAKNAANLGTQIDALSNKVPTSKAALNELAIALMKSKLSGVATVDAFNAVAQASAALGDEAGGKIKEFIERGRMFGKFRIDPSEMLEGFGNLDFNDVAESLAKGMNVSVAAARKALASGTVKLDDGAKAMRDAIEKRFGGINLRKMMSFEVIAEKLQEKFAALTSGVNLEPLLKPLSELGALFDDSTVTGQTLKMLMTQFGTAVVSSLTTAIPLAKALFQGAVIGALEAYIAYLKVRNALRETFGNSKLLDGVDALSTAVTVGKYAMIGIVGAIVAVGAVMALGMVPVVAFAAGMVWLSEASANLGLSLRRTFLEIDWKATGASVVHGLVAGLMAGPEAIIGAVKSLAGTVKRTFTGEMKIQSPSKVMFQLGSQVPAGVAGGIEAGTADVGSAASGMAGATQRGASGMGGGARGAGVVVNVTIHAGGGGGGEAAKQLSEASFLAQLTKAVEDALLGAGIPVQG